MEKIYSTQDYLRIELQYEGELPNNLIDNVKIKYVDPNGEAGEWPAIHDSVNKVIYYDVPKGHPLGVVGKWTAWSFVTMTDGRELPGSPCSINVYAEGGDGCITGNCY